jgi:D-alanyl-lipoteichoic acid acyltransferase DltB (MBOAT superfamily)
VQSVAVLFNSAEFIFIFVPLAVGLHFAAARHSMAAAAVATTLSSLFFYAWWSPVLVLLPILSIVGNFLIARSIAVLPETGARRLMIAGVAANLLVLGYFKYEDFFLAIIEARTPVPPAVPLALSFTTFVQIAFLVHVWRNRSHPDFPRYAMFVSFFPHLIAGPIVRWTDLGTQIGDRLRYKFDFNNVAMGLTVFCFGLVKKVLIADGLAPQVGPVFDAAALSEPITPFAAWGAAFAYSAQLFFDFSGYCDMAVGLGLLFNFRLPINFAAPLRSTNIIDFWRRWHITLASFLRDFVYVPMGGSKCGAFRQSFNLITTLVLGGLWHGANWTFIAWGAFNGVLLVVNHAWRSFRGPRDPTRLGRFAGWCATFTAFAVGMVMFRSANIGATRHMLLAMVGFANGPESADHGAVDADRWLIYQGYLSRSFVHFLAGRNWSVAATLATLAALAIALLVPDTMEIVDYREGEPHAKWRRATQRLAWQPSVAWLALVGILFGFSFTYLWRFNEFLYYQF